MYTTFYDNFVTLLCLMLPQFALDFIYDSKGNYLIVNILFKG